MDAAVTAIRPLKPKETAVSAQLKTAKVAGMQTFVEKITPDQAREFLRKNKTNRPLRQSWIRTLADIISRGEWKVTHQGVAITTDNELLDGQHRLNAIVLTGIAVEMNVSYDCDPSSFMVIDGGIKRTTSDHLRVPAIMAATAKMIWKLPAPTSTKIPSSQQVAGVLEWARPFIEKTNKVGGTKSKRTSASIQMPVVVHMMGAREEQVLPLYEAFAAFAIEDMPASVRSLTKQVMEKTASATMNPWDLACRAWKAFDPDNWETARIQLKGTEVPVSEMSRVAEVYRLKHTKKK